MAAAAAAAEGEEGEGGSWRLVVVCCVCGVRGQLMARVQHVHTCMYLLYVKYIAHQLKLPSSEHTNFYVTKVGYILNTEYVLPKCIFFNILPRWIVPM